MSHTFSASAVNVDSFFFFYNIDSSLFSRTTSPLLNKWFANIFFPTNFLLLLLSFLLLAFFIWGNTGLLHYIFHGQHCFLLLYTLHWQRGKSISISLRKNSLFNNVVGASIVKKMHVPTQKNEPQPKPPGHTNVNLKEITDKYKMWNYRTFREKKRRHL